MLVRRAFPKTIKLRVEEIVKERLTVNPIDFGESFCYKLKGYRRLIPIPAIERTDRE